ncbi:MAG: hypothetical protein WCH52_10065 [Bacteroidota bacterium]
MTGILFCIIVLIIKEVIQNLNNQKPSPETNIYYQDGKPKQKNAIIEQIRKSAKVSYIMDHGTSILNTHEYCYMSYLQLDIMGTTFSQSALFNNYSMSFTAPTKVPLTVIEAAKSYLKDRTDYLSCLN